MKKLVYLLLLTLSVSYAQDQASNWYFGENAGIQFNVLSGDVTVLTDGQLNTREGCSSISDEDGNLLFYTDGSTVYNKNHGIMSNGENLYGDESSTQSAIVVPKPDDINTYYIFTVDNAINGSNYGLNFSIVDMTLDSGLGGVTIKNNRLLDKCSEKITAVLKDCQDASIWLIAFADVNGNSDNFNTYHAFEITTAGVNHNSVKSTFGIDVTDARGYLKASPDGTKLASANVTSGMYLYDFNTNNGYVSNQVTMTINGPNSYAYGIEFSPSNQYLYIHSYNDANGGPFTNTSTLSQFDLFAPDLMASQVVLDNRGLYRGGLQLGPNGKIYRSLSESYNAGIPYLGVINNPNAAGLAANYVHQGVDLNGVNSTQGLPPFITSFFNQKIDIIQNGTDTTYLPLCDGDAYTLMADNIPGADYTWYQDGALLASETSYNLVVNQSGTYEVIIDLPGGNCEVLEGKAIVEYFTNPSVTNTTLIQCDEDNVNDGLTVFNLQEADESLTNSNPDLQVAYYTNQADAQSNTNPITNLAFANTANPQKIYASITSIAAGCSAVADVNLQVSTTHSNNTSLLVCDDDGTEDGFYEFDLSSTNADILQGLPAGLNVFYYETYMDALLEENAVNNIYTNTQAFNQTIYARVENMNDCYGISEIAISVHAAPQFNENNTIYYCLNTHPETIALQSGVIGNPNTYTYSWSTGATTQEIQINETGDYTVEVTDTFGCTNSNTITVEASNIATIDSIEIEDASTENTVTVMVSGEGTYEYALYNQAGPYRFFQTSNIFTQVAPGGIYTVVVRDVKNNCGIVEQTISVIGFPKFFTPNDDGTNDYWQVYGVSEIFQPSSKIKIFDRYGKLIKEISPTGKGWDGTINGEKLPVSDYWFAVTLQDGREYFNHFTLKR
ncbi:MAG: T9SS type B sorting domain-containing protein [Oceanihabitans sp.]